MPKNKDFQTIYNLIQEGQSYTDIQKEHKVGSSTITKLKAMSPDQFNTWLVEQNKPKTTLTPPAGNPADRVAAGIRNQGVEEALKLSKDMVQGFSQDSQDKFSKMFESAMMFKVMNQVMGNMEGNGHQDSRVIALEKQLAKQEEAAKFREVIQEIKGLQKDRGSSTPDSLAIMKLLLDQANMNQTNMLDLMKTSNNGGGGDKFKEIADGIDSLKRMTKLLGPEKESKTEILSNMLGSTVQSALKSEGVQSALRGWGDKQTAGAMAEAERIALREKVRKAKEDVAKNNPGNPGKPPQAPIVDPGQIPVNNAGSQMSTAGVRAGQVSPELSAPGVSSEGGAESLSRSAPPIPPKPEPGSADEYAAFLNDVPNNEETIPVSDSLIMISDQPSKGNKAPKTLDQEIAQKASEMRTEAARAAEAESFAQAMSRSDEQNSRRGVDDSLVMISDKKPPDFRGGKL